MTEFSHRSIDPFFYWKSQRNNDHATFELYFRKNPFKGEYTIFGGLSEALKFLKNFKITDQDLKYLKKLMPDSEDEFFEYLKNLTTVGLKIEALPEGSICFPRVPLLIIHGPLPLVQIIETPLLNLINFSSLVATNASRMRFAAGDKVSLLEFGLRRAQGPNGGMTASKYSVIGGFDGTSNVLAGKLYNLPVKGTHSHSYVNSFTTLEENHNDPIYLVKNKNEKIDILNNARLYRKDIIEILNQQKVNIAKTPKDSELIAFCHYAATFPESCLCLIDTYDTLGSGLINFMSVSAVLISAGYKPIGLRLDSGDLSYLSIKIREIFQILEKADPEKFHNFSKLKITASNSINEATLYALKEQGHEIDAFGIGTHLVTCQAQPALGCVYKLTELNGHARMKLTEEISKITIPGKKAAYRIFNKNDQPLVDVMTLASEEPPKVGENYLIRHPFVESKRAYVCPSRVEKLHSIVFEDFKIVGENLEKELDDYRIAQERCRDGLKSMRRDHLRAVQPTPYKVSLSSKMYAFLHEEWMKNAPIGLIN